MAILNVKQAVEHLGKVFGEYTIYDMVRKGQIPTVKITGRRILFNSKKLDEWLENDCVMKEEWKQEHQEARPSAYGKLRQLSP